MAAHSHVALREAGSAAAAEGGGRGRVAVRRELGIDSFGVNAFFQAKSGEPVIDEHDELGPGATLDALAESLAAWPDYQELAAGDDDLEALRDDPRFQALVR
jgi:hypothetical protein